MTSGFRIAPVNQGCLLRAAIVCGLCSPALGFPANLVDIRRALALAPGHRAALVLLLQVSLPFCRAKTK